MKHSVMNIALACLVLGGRTRRRLTVMFELSFKVESEFSKPRVMGTTGNRGGAVVS